MRSTICRNPISAIFVKQGKSSDLLSHSTSGVQEIRPTVGTRPMHSSTYLDARSSKISQKLLADRIQDFPINYRH